MFEVRGYVLDVSRGKVPTMSTFRQIVDLLKVCGYNRLLLCVGRGPRGDGDGPGRSLSSPLAPAEIRELDCYCRMNDVGLVPDLDSPGRIDGDGSPFAEEREEERLGEMLRRFDAVRSRGRRPTFWADLALRRPELVGRMPKDAVAIVRGCEGGHPFRAEAEAFRRFGLDFCVCSCTGARNSLAGRVESVRECLSAAESAGRLGGARGFLVADWGGGGDWQPLAASLPGIVLGGWFAEYGAKANRMDLEEALDTVMGVPLGGTLLRLGTLYLRGGALREGESELYRILAGDRGYSRHPGLTDSVLAEVSAVAEGCRHAASAFASPTIYGIGAIWAEEVAYMANLVDAACHRRDSRRLGAVREELRRTWLQRNRPDGLEDALARMPRF